MNSKQEYPVEVWDNNLKYYTTAPARAPDGYHRYFRCYSSLNGEEYFFGDYIHFWNCYGGMGPEDGGVIRGLADTFTGSEISIVDSTEIPRH